MGHEIDSRREMYKIFSKPSQKFFWGKIKRSPHHVDELHDRSWHCVVFMPHCRPSNCWNTKASIGAVETCRGQRKYVRVAIAASVNTIQT